MMTLESAEKLKIIRNKDETINSLKKNNINYKENFFLIVGIGINTHFSPSILNLKACSLANFSQKKVDNNRILKDIIKSYEKFIDDCKKYNFELLKKRLK